MPGSLLDVGPGQPSFTPPGFLSLHMLKKPILGPPFTSPSLPKHPIAPHHIRYTTPREDPSAYIRAILTLLSDYHSAVASEPGPLVINSAGWTKALGLELLQEIIAASCVSEIIFITSALDNSIPITSVLPLTNPPRVHVLESSAGEGSKFTAADLRSLQISSFLHYSPDTLRWAGMPLSALKPWRLPYAGAQAAIHGISLLQEEDLSPDELLTAIDGTLVAILEIDDDLDLDSAIITTKENLPYLPIPPPPERSRALGMALVKGVDVQKMEIWIVATMGVGEVQGLAGKRTVLVRGRLELSIGEVVAGVEEFGGADRGGVPWVSFAGRGGSGDGKGAGAWRVRRNLMRRGQQQG
ncbi:hypothetical protein L873DRAFT_1790144 [Choiromyces venosus 120613-1]|uniref:Polynucleotide 5'-hydroxyl-kinase GRC3 n=1 Tax=Choiromyces venosus 120613-1 TaxID=1336337 RepID=A0A3N4JKJ7_9PEZI|nr:hypothetical protein L873DRAFT_1790144 [Choiromyces venosus 120613-1]